MVSEPIFPADAERSIITLDGVLEANYDISPDDLMDAFLVFISSKGWGFGGGIGHSPAEERAEQADAVMTLQRQIDEYEAGTRHQPCLDRVAALEAALRNIVANVSYHFPDGGYGPVTTYEDKFAAARATENARALLSTEEPGQ